ncbi:extracellular solute-binding protein family 1 [Ketogulonicigenium vulgare Y25]|nr:extracellular solute-binding protein family 1 [Ketogulonicigenium vulgare Y25]AOZ54957.1 extracellular solute-binding protein family 1 [Ketogulonicigenium vulgare]
MQALADVFAANGGTWVDVPVAGPSNATATAVNRIVGGTPPAAFRLSVGGEILTMAEQGLLRPIEVEGLDLDATIPTVFQAGLKYEDEYYGIPLNVQSVNWVFASNKALAEAGVTEYPTDLDSFSRRWMH